jgi:hypothetical protein
MDMPTNDFTYRIWNINLCNHCAKWKEKIPELSLKIAKIDLETGKHSDLFAFCEVKYESVMDGKDQEMAPRKMQCGDKRYLVPECFGHLWKENIQIDSQPITKQYGELGIVVNGETFELEGHFIKEEIAKVGWLGLGPPLLILGARFRHKKSGNILPFYVTHTRGDENRMKKACKNIVEVVISNWHSNDIVPIIVGDFNFSASSVGYWSILEEYFEEAANKDGHDIIEHFWVGRASKFPGKGKKITNLNFDLNDDFLPPDKIDHPCPSLVIEEEKRTHNEMNDFENVYIEWWDKKDFSGNRHRRPLDWRDAGRCIKLRHNDAMKSIKFYGKPGWKLEIYDSPNLCSQTTVGI